ncbi:MAG TPA: hypothetical protein VEQ59_15330 [Polyangiaceae bacterium]|nr:hypothetical protein [Polyangiaceae bacterium]
MKTSTCHVFTLLFAAAVALCSLSCKSKDDDGGGGCGLEIDGKEYELIYACDAPFGGTISSVRLCTEYYSNVKDAVLQSVAGICTALGGKGVETCSTEQSAGSCTDTSTTGGGQGLVAVTYGYTTEVTPQQYQADCDGVYAPPGTPPASAPSGSSNVTSTCPASTSTSTSSSSGVAFSMATIVNGEVINCTNYIGTVTAPQLQGVLSIGATTDACPEAGSACSCLTHGGGTYGTDAMQVFYDTSMTSRDESDCESVKGSCKGEYNEPYRAP